VKEYVEITPGRPTIAEHRHPNDTVRGYIDFKTADIQTKLNIMIITSQIITLISGIRTKSIMT
jgi:hypothetical protein